jgi:2,3-bisphosphoglycerate-dependent phosphoglycerate mutase
MSVVRHYGALQGLDKKETVAKYGDEQVNLWRRSYNIPPPPVDTTSSHYPGNDRKYASNAAASKIRTESLEVMRHHMAPSNC